jgi:hypothetical protein
MKRWFICLALFAALGASAAPLGIIVPAYFYPTPGGLWHSMSNAATRVPLVAILNPNSGPGASQDSTYVAAVTNLHKAGGQTIGYVHTSYSAQPLATAEAEVDLYYQWYAMDGIFLDEVTDDADTNHLNYYAALYQYIKGKSTNALVVANPGINTVENYLTRPTAEVLVTFEVNTGYSNYVADSWVTNHLARHFCHLPYDVATAATMTNYVNLAISRNAGWIYVTNDKGSNPWDTLPSYWTNEVEYIRSLNPSAPATRLAVLGVSNNAPNLRLTGAAGVYELQATSNFSSWFTVRNVSAPTGTNTIPETSATNADKRFYRTRQ